jgi:hypothetical protein
MMISERRRVYLKKSHLLVGIFLSTCCFVLDYYYLSGKEEGVSGDEIISYSTPKSKFLIAEPLVITDESKLNSKVSTYENFLMITTHSIC